MDRPGQLRTFDKVQRICYAENIFFFTFALQIGWICSWRNKTNQFLQSVGGPHFFEPFPICVFGWITPLYHCVLFWGGRHTFSHESVLQKETPVIDHNVTELRFGQRPKKGQLLTGHFPENKFAPNSPLTLPCTPCSFMSPSILAPLFLHLYVLIIRPQSASSISPYCMYTALKPKKRKIASSSIDFWCTYLVWRWYPLWASLSSEYRIHLRRCNVYIGLKALSKKSVTYVLRDAQLFRREI